ncbi:MAG: efflux RND transporter periplasmic adaptor subunit [Candidatus Doudnabacteria bacterium]|nr:efflux RND transporter periplasmic adaptor subunit [Candidatus Doudnabacteria bacterium]
MTKNLSKPIIVSVAGILLVLGTGAYAETKLQKKPNYDYVEAKQENLQTGVKTDGTVKAAENLSLSFQKGGQISVIKVKVGDKVKKGTALISLDAKDSLAAVNQANAAVSAAQASYNKLLNGATNADAEVAEVALTNAKQTLENTTQQQQTLVDNAYKNLLNAGLAATPGSGNSAGAAAFVSGSYTGTQQGSYTVSVYATGSGLRFRYSGLEDGDGIVDITPQPLGKKGLFIQFSSTSVPTNNTWTVNLPNTQGVGYTSYLTAYQAAQQNQQSAVNAAQNAVNSAQAALDLKKSAARPEDLQAAQAQISSARALLQLAQNSYTNSIITAPIDGVITSVDAKIGETATVGKSVVSMISDQQFQVETYLSENEVGQVKPDDTVKITLDAYGDQTVFDASIITIDPAATIINGIPAYKLTLQFTQEDNRIKAGMGANIIVAGQQKSNILTIPQNSIIKQNDQTFVLVKNQQGQPTLTAVQTGSLGLNGREEILSGLAQGQLVASFSGK